MIQYLINSTAIWLVSLILFDLFLRKESYHNYNRFYLLFTFLLGAFLPLFQWNQYLLPPSGTIQKPVEQVITIKRSLVAASTPSVGALHWFQWLYVAYFAGVIISIILLAIDALKLYRYRRLGTTYFEDGWQIIATGEEHAPFSFGRKLFFSARCKYSDQEWAMILKHEQRHSSLFHSADLLLMQLARIVFWFQPLVYLYNKRLLLVHEFQADSAAAAEPATYGSFLVEQSLLQSAPNLSHSFNRSPIKNRLIMLTRKSSSAARTKMLVFVPLAFVCLLCFTRNAMSQGFKKDGNKVTYRGNIIEVSVSLPDTLTMIDPVTGGEITRYITKIPYPVKVNGQLVPQDVDKSPVFTGSDKNLRDYLIKNLKDELSLLEDGQYALDVNTIYINEEGQIIYYVVDELRRSKTAEEISSTPNPQGPETVKVANPELKITIQDPNSKSDKPVTLYKNSGPKFFGEINKETWSKIYNKICLLMESAPAFTPGTVGNKKVVAQYTDGRFLNHIKVANHKVYDLDKDIKYQELK